MHSWGKFWIQKLQRDQKNPAAIFRSLEQKQDARSKSRVLYMPPAHIAT